MKSEELRIGNYILKRQKVEKVHSLQDDEINYTIENVFSPIPLTEETLLRCGFEINDSTFNTKAATLKEYVPDRSPLIVILDINGNLAGPALAYERSTNVKSIHQLQNLYFALTGKELEVEL
jgi:hypothetical protein